MQENKINMYLNQFSAYVKNKEDNDIGVEVLIKMVEQIYIELN